MRIGAGENWSDFGVVLLGLDDGLSWLCFFFFFLCLLIWFDFVSEAVAYGKAGDFVGLRQFVWQMHCVGICVVFVVLAGGDGERVSR